MINFTRLLSVQHSSRKNFWLIEGESDALVSDCVDIFLNHAKSGLDDVEVLSFNDTEVDTDSLVSLITTPRYGGRLVVTIYTSDNENLDLRVLESVSDPSVFVAVVKYGLYSEEADLRSQIKELKKSRHVVCSKISDNKLGEWVATRLDLDPLAMANLLSKANGDLEWLLNQMRVLEALGLPAITSQIIDVVCSGTGQKPFEEALIQFDKQQCFRYIKGNGCEDIDIHQVIEDIRALSLIQTVAGWHNLKMRPLSDKTGLHIRELNKYMDKVPYFDLQSTSRSIESITRSYVGLARGDKRSYLSLICRW